MTCMGTERDLLAHIPLRRVTTLMPLLLMMKMTCFSTNLDSISINWTIELNLICIIISEINSHLTSEGHRQGLDPMLQGGTVCLVHTRIVSSLQYIGDSNVQMMGKPMTMARLFSHLVKFDATKSRKYAFPFTYKSTWFIIQFFCQLKFAFL